MKKKIFTLSALALLALTACTEKKTTTVNETAVDTVAVDATATTATDTIVSPETAAEAPATTEAPAADAIITVQGTVTTIVPGKDGYTATITTKEGKAYNAVISIPNLKNPKQYKLYNVGQPVTVTGPSYMVGSDVTIKAEAVQ